MSKINLRIILYLYFNFRISLTLKLVFYYAKIYILEPVKEQVKSLILKVEIILKFKLKLDIIRLKILIKKLEIN